MANKLESQLRELAVGVSGKFVRRNANDTVNKCKWLIYEIIVGGHTCTLFFKNGNTDGLEDLGFEMMLKQVEAHV